MLVDGVVTAIKRAGADGDTLLLGDFFRPDEACGIASARGGDGRIEWMGKGVAEGDARRGSLNKRFVGSVFRHAGLCCHARAFYTAPRRRARFWPPRLACGSIGERNSPAEAHEDARKGELPLLFQRVGFGLSIGVFPREPFDPAGCVQKLLFAGKERMTTRAYLNAQEFALDRRACLKSVPAGAMDGYGVIVRMDSRLHESSILRGRSARRFFGKRSIAASLGLGTNSNDTGIQGFCQDRRGLDTQGLAVALHGRLSL